MGEVRRYFCCTDNLSGCKILGGIQLVYIGIAFILAIYALSTMSDSDKSFEGLSDNEKDAARGLAGILLTAIFGLLLLFPIFLIVGAVKRNSCLLMTCIILNGLGLPFYVYEVFASIDAEIFQNLVGLGIGIWVELVAIGGYEEAKYSVNSV